MNVTVITFSTQSDTLVGGYSYTPAPAVTLASPNNGPDTGGTSVTLTGTDFVTGQTTVTFGGNAATGVTVVTATSLTCTTPSYVTAIPKAVDVVVTTYGSQSGTAAGGFTYIPPPTDFNLATPDHLRIVFLPRIEAFDDAMARLGRFLGRLRRD